MLIQITVYSTRVVLISFIILGTIGNILNLFIFTRPALLKSSCTLYLLAASIDNILVIYTSLFMRLLSNGFSYDVATIAEPMCKLRYYFGYIFFVVSPYFFILACFDRYCSSSTSATRRSWSNQRLAKRCIIVAIILACVLYLHIVIFYGLHSKNDEVQCGPQPGVYDTFWRIYYLVVVCILPSFCMGFLCVLTLINIRRQSRRIVQSLAAGIDGRLRIDRQMIRMLFLQVLTQLLCILPNAMINLLGLFIDTETNLYNFFSQIFILPLFVSYTTSFYVFTMSSRTYRQELLNIIPLRERQQAMRRRGRTMTIGNIRQFPRASLQL